VTFCLNANDWFDLQEPISLPVEVELPPAARKLYDEMERELFIELAGDLSIEAMSGASRSNKCLQIACGAVFDNEEEKSWHEVHDAKLEALRDIVEESAGAPLLVAYNFTFDRERILKAFPNARVLTYDHDIEDWNAGKIAMLLVHPASAGHGLNLQDGGNRLVFYSQGWSLENRLQVIERIGPTRQMQSGYDRPVYVYSIVAADTIEQTVLLPAMFGKRATQDALMESRRTRV
jgi:SNF2 family DNA or RNA helicase